MKTKLTLTIDAELLPRAKRHARDRGVSLSALVEEALRSAASEDAPSFVERWRGRFEPASRDDERFRALAEKYL
jgi:post-segregation antitoxin (ccd killing protein)